MVSILVLDILLVRVFFIPWCTGFGQESMLHQAHPLCSSLSTGTNSFLTMQIYVWKLKCSSSLTYTSKGIDLIISGTCPISSSTSRISPCHTDSLASIFPPTKPHMPSFLPAAFCNNRNLRVFWLRNSAPLPLTFLIIILIIRQDAKSLQDILLQNSWTIFLHPICIARRFADL